MCLCVKARKLSYYHCIDFFVGEDELGYVMTGCFKVEISPVEKKEKQPWTIQLPLHSYTGQIKSLKYLTCLPIMKCKASDTAAESR